MGIWAFGRGVSSAVAAAVNDLHRRGEHIDVRVCDVFANSPPRRSQKVHQQIDIEHRFLFGERRRAAVAGVWERELKWHTYDTVDEQRYEHHILDHSSLVARVKHEAGRDSRV